MQVSLSDYQKKVALKECPSLLEIAAYVYFPSSFLVGPQFSMRRYLDFVNGTLIENSLDLRTSCLAAGCKRAAFGFVYVAMFQLGTVYVSDQYLLTDDYRQSGFLTKLFLLGLWGRVNLYKYISCWLITEGVSFGDLNAGFFYFRSIRQTLRVGSFKFYGRKNFSNLKI